MSLRRLLLLALVSTPVLGKFAYTVTGISYGKPIPPSSIVFEPKALSLHRLNRTSSVQEKTNLTISTKKLARQQKNNPVLYSANWCGAVQHPGGDSTNKITNVHAHFQIPTVSPRYPGDGAWFLATWVGIDRAKWPEALLQAGILSLLGADGIQSNGAWVEWVPDKAYDIPSFPGDNLNQSTAYTVSLVNGSPLGQVDADWVVEAPMVEGFSIAPYSRFDNVWFKNCSASTTNGTTRGVDGADMYY
ncbi:concanavalin A-like lectin/glucanase domain-containing protein [Sordaria sp. MPI-SDFR-AT-0083]|nr:concanavalin A-like lectin/glucanase domain-containing protein [Sordaria sp. MPI-SDFR-AT-0083]